MLNSSFVQVMVAETFVLFLFIFACAVILKLRVDWKWIVIAICVSVFSDLFAFLGASYAFGNWISGSYNFEGKIIASLFLMTIAIIFFQTDLKAVGLTLSQRGPSPNLGYALAGFTFIATGLFMYFYFPGVKSEPAIDMLYQATMPSIHEELFYRGLLLAFLIKAFTPNASKSKVSLGIALAAAVTCLQFWAGHSIFTDGSWGIEFRPWWNLATLFYAILWVGVRLATGSLVLPMLLHTWTNCAGYFL